MMQSKQKAVHESDHQSTSTWDKLGKNDKSLMPHL